MDQTEENEHRESDKCDTQMRKQANKLCIKERISWREAPSSIENVKSFLFVCTPGARLDQRVELKNSPRAKEKHKTHLFYHRAGGTSLGLYNVH